MLYIVGNFSSNAARIYTFRRYFFSPTAVIAGKRQFLFTFFSVRDNALTQASCGRPTNCVNKHLDRQLYSGVIFVRFCFLSKTLFRLKIGLELGLRA